MGAGLSLAAFAWFHRLACSRLIGAGDLSQDARGERRRGKERGERGDGKVPRAGLNKETGHRPASLFFVARTTLQSALEPKRGHFEI